MEVEVESVELVEAEEAGAEASLPAASGGERRGGQQGGGQQRDGHRSGSTEATREGDQAAVEALLVGVRAREKPPSPYHLASRSHWLLFSHLFLVCPVRAWTWMGRMMTTRRSAVPLMCATTTA